MLLYLVIKAINEELTWHQEWQWTKEEWDSWRPTFHVLWVLNQGQWNCWASKEVLPID